MQASGTDELTGVMQTCMINDTYDMVVFFLRLWVLAACLGYTSKTYKVYSIICTPPLSQYDQQVCKIAKILIIIVS